MHHIRINYLIIIAMMLLFQAILLSNAFTLLTCFKSSIFRSNFLPMLKEKFRHSFLKDLEYPVEEFPMDPIDAYPARDPKMTPEEQEAILESYRQLRIFENDRWQSYLFKGNQSGAWEGTFELFEPVIEGSSFILDLTDSGRLDSSITSTDGPNGASLTLNETQSRKTKSDKPFFPSIVSSLEPADFRREKGNQAVGNAYTLYGERSDGTPSDASQNYLAEIGVCTGPLRNRCRFLYSKSASAATTPEDGFDLSLAGVLVVKEYQAGSPIEETLSLGDLVPGAPIYDPQAFGDDYCSVQLPGRLSLLFPRGLRVFSGEGFAPISTLCMQVDSGNMRYQLDRRFRSIGPGLVSLELIEISVQDAETYKIEEHSQPQ